MKNIIKVGHGEKMEMKKYMYDVDYIEAKNVDKNCLGFIYITINLVNGKRYVGQRKFSKGWRTYLGSGKGFLESLKKYGRSKFTRIVLEICDSQEALDAREVHYIKLYNAVKDKNFYNIACGGQNGFESILGGWTEDDKKALYQMMSERNSGEGNGMFGKKGELNPTAKSVGMFCPKTGTLIRTFGSIALSEEFIQAKGAFKNISRVCINKKGMAYGYMWLFMDDYNDYMERGTLQEWLNNTSHRKDMEGARGKAVYKIDKKSLQIVGEYENAFEASVQNGGNTNQIMKCCQHKHLSAIGFYWFYKEEYDRLSKEEFVKLCKTNLKKSSTKSVVCLNTGEKFESLKGAAETYKIKPVAISRCVLGLCKTGGEHPVTGERLKWAYCEGLSTAA